MTHLVKSPRKLIEVTLPLDAINEACAREKSIRHGHPSTLHLWWARRPLAAARAVIFAQLVNDPGFQQGGGFRYGKNKKEAAIERQRLFKIMDELVLWESTSNEEVLERARVEIRRSWREVCDLNREHPEAAVLFNPDKPPALHDPFAGGGAIPLEAQRLGVEVCASDLNPVAVLINKAMIEFPARFAGRPPVNSASQAERTLVAREWHGSQGLAADLRHYGLWMRDEATKRIGNLYPRVTVTPELVASRPELSKYLGDDLTVIACLWARTVKSPNPAFAHVDVPLASTFIVSTKEGKEAYVEPVIEGASYRFVVRVGKPPDTQDAKNGTKSARGAFRCLLSNAPISGDYIAAEGRAARMGMRLMAVVAEGTRERVYLTPTDEMEVVALQAKPAWKPDVEFFQQALGFRVGRYGMSMWSDLFTSRQLAALTTFSDLIAETRERVRRDAIAAGLSDVGGGLSAGGAGSAAYAEAIGVYLSFALDKTIAGSSSLCTWMHQRDSLYHTFAKQALSMTWDFAEVNVLADCTRSLSESVEWTAESIEGIAIPSPVGNPRGMQADACTQTITAGSIVSTDPPYFDNIGYADLSDFFYVWLRRSQREAYPDLFATLTVPKAAELVATPVRHGSKANAEAFFLGGMTEAMHRLAEQAHPAFPVTIYYAFKQAETDSETGTSSTGWETFLGAVVRAGFAITGTWPLRTERDVRSRGLGSNALASSIVLACRRRSPSAPTVSRRDFLRELNSVLPVALDEMIRGAGEDRSPVAPVDLSQAIIGPGMAVFSKYTAVLEADGSPMSVRTALQHINRFLAEDDFDADTQFCLHWFDQNGWSTGKFGEADTLARAKGTSVDGVKNSGVITSGAGVVCLKRWSELPADWDPATDTRNPVWETLHHLIRALKNDGDSGAGRLLAATKDKAEPARQLAYRLYTLCERKGWADDARVYNEIITSWSGIEAAAATTYAESAQGKLFD